MVYPASTLDMDKICRVCMKTDELELFLIFDEKYAVDRTSLAAMLTECTMYKVNRYDEFPHQICAACMADAKSAFSFKRRCEQTYRLLIDMLTKEDITPGRIKVESSDIYDEKSTQTEDSTLYPCERCNEKFFTFDALRAHRENDHKGSAIVCRFCSKSFNRVGYLKTHIAVFHPESGYMSHNQCSICSRQFTRREHMRRHLAVIHKIVEIVDAAPELEENNECSKSETFDSLNKSLTSLNERSKHSKQSPLNSDCKEKAAQSDSEDDSRFDNVDDDVKRTPVSDDDEDEKPLADFLTIPRKNFVEVLIDECAVIDKLLDFADFEESTDSIKQEPLASTPSKQPLEFDALTAVERNRRKRSDTTRLTTAESSNSSDDQEEQEYKCEKCEKIFKRRFTLQRHMLNHSEEKAFACKICEKRFARADYLKNHINSVHEMKCEQCNLVFTHITQLKQHQNTKHNVKKHQCEICQKNFSTKLYMQRHLASHGKKRFVCKECSSKFQSKEELAAHIKAEGHDKPLLCPECGLRCKTSNILMVHMRRHKGEKPFKCKFCSKGFPRVDDLRIHEKYHTGEKSHFCETCGKGFQRKYNLTIHMRVHTGEKPYKCPHCPHAFTQSNDLKSHIRRHTGERFRCELCGAPFLQGYQMRQHKLTEHGVKENPPTQRVEKYTSTEQQELQIKQNMQRELAESTLCSTDISMAPSLDVDANSIGISIEPALIPPTEISFLNM